MELPARKTSGFNRCFLVVLTGGFLLLSANLYPQHRNLGVGFTLGEPTGISVKNWLNRTAAVDGAIAWSFANQDRLHIHVDYLQHHLNLIKLNYTSFTVYYGLGARAKFERKFRLGARVPLGLNYLFQKAPLDLFLELAPLIDLLPDTEIKFNGALGIRYFF